VDTIGRQTEQEELQVISTKDIHTDVLISRDRVVQLMSYNELLQQMLERQLEHEKHHP
jgi:hypothetical protein